MESSNKQQLIQHLQVVGLSEQSATSLCSILSTDGSLPKVQAAFKSIIQRRGEMASLAKKAFHELETLTNNLSYLGVKVSF